MEERNMSTPFTPQPTGLKLRTRHHAANRYERDLPPMACAVDFYHDIKSELLRLGVTAEVGILVMRMLWDEYERVIEQTIEGEWLLDDIEERGDQALIEAVQYHKKQDRK